jgi:hypothetical protein
MILTSPPSLPRSRLWAGLGVRWPSQSHPVIQGLPVLKSLPFNSLSVPGYKKNDYRSDTHSFLTTTNWILPAHTPRSLPPLLLCLASHFRQGRVASVPPAPHPPIKGLPIPKSFPPVPSSRVVLRFVLSPFTTSSSRAARPQPPFLLQNANVNLLAKMPMSTSSPNYRGSSEVGSSRYY